MKATIYHNPRCTKSRETLALLEERGVKTVIVEYLEDPPDEETLRDLIEKLEIRPKELLRRKEAAFKALGLASKLEDDGAIIAAILREPVLMERPIVVVGEKARIGRPPEKVLELFR
jgi:arsenate reductase